MLAHSLGVTAPCAIRASRTLCGIGWRRENQEGDAGWYPLGGTGRGRIGKGEGVRRSPGSGEEASPCNIGEEGSAVGVRNPSPSSEKERSCRTGDEGSVPLDSFGPVGCPHLAPHGHFEFTKKHNLEGIARGRVWRYPFFRQYMNTRGRCERVGVREKDRKARQTRKNLT